MRVSPLSPKATMTQQEKPSGEVVGEARPRSRSHSAVSEGVRAAVVTTGHHPLSLLRIMRGEDIGTLFLAGAGASSVPLASKL